MGALGRSDRVSVRWPLATCYILLTDSMLITASSTVRHDKIEMYHHLYLLEMSTRKRVWPIPIQMIDEFYEISGRRDIFLEDVIWISRNR
jgi:hypothetical protein